jgi:hypothetical protein
MACDLHVLSCVADAPANSSCVVGVVTAARCAGGVNPEHRVADIKSMSLQIGRGLQSTQIKSSVEVMPMAALAARNFAAVRSARGRACLRRLLPEVIGGSTASATRFGPAKLTFLPPVHGSFGARITTSVAASSPVNPVRVPVYLDIFAILAGPAEVTLTSTSISHAASVTTEHRLLSLLVERANAHKLGET